MNPLYAKVAMERPKAAVFDLDGTIFDNFQRFKDARRAGLIDNNGKPVQKGRQSMGAAWKKRNKFLYSKKNLAKDTVIPGSKELISSLTNDGYIIIYLTARPKEYYTEILGQLESNGFPLFRDNAERVMLITRPAGNRKAAEYKGDEVRKLRGEFDVRMVFDDDLDALSEISKYDVPGLYSSVSDHIKVNPRVRRNGGHIIKPEAHDFRDGQFVTGTDDPDVASDMMRDPDLDPDDREQTVGETSGRVITPESVQMSLEEFGENIRENPVKRGKDSKGPFYKWGKGKKYHYKAGNEKSREAARKKAYEQAKAAFAGGYRKNPEEVRRNFLGFGKKKATDPIEAYESRKMKQLAKGITIYGADWCQWCKEAKKLCRDNNVKYKYHNFDKLTESEGQQERYFLQIDIFVQTAKKYPYIPVVFVGSYFLGGFTDLENFLKMSKAKQLAHIKKLKKDAKDATGVLMEIENAGLDGLYKSSSKKNPTEVKTNPGVLPNFLGFGKKKEKKDKVIITITPPDEILDIFKSENIPVSEDSIEMYRYLAEEFQGSRMATAVAANKKVAKKMPPKYRFKAKGITIYTTKKSKLSPESQKTMAWAVRTFKDVKVIIVEEKEMNRKDFDKWMETIYKPMTELRADFGVFPKVIVDGYSIGTLSQLRAYALGIDSERHKKKPNKKKLETGLVYKKPIQWRGSVEKNPEVKTNPAHPKKVEKGKKLYKHMNGQAPEKVKVEKIDIGDVWYKVGEGGCWQIGYMSGKETGQESQKYIHTFNEETQDGNFPELYATMPEKGKPMLIIKGGTWKIRTDDQGVAWIYD